MNRFGEIGKKIVVMMAVFTCVLLSGRRAYASESVSLRVISTTDIHSQVNDEDYDVAGKSYAQSLARLSTMIKGAREEITEGTSITVDVGDDIYGYGAEAVMGGELPTNNNIQPVFLAMQKIGYDAVTLGNHDFDYGYDYIKQQLSDTGLDKVCVVANAKDLATGEYPWERTKIITKEVVTSKGNRIELKIGIVGATRQELSTYYDYNGILQGESILKTVREQAAALKEQGADIVIAMAHCGFGAPGAGDASSDPGYAMTEIEDVDCVVLGHQHRNYPSMDSNVKFVYEYPEVDKETGLINGKPVIMVADHAAGIAIADLKLKVGGEAVTVTGASTELRRCSAFVPLDEEIARVTDIYDTLIRGKYDEEFAKVEEPGEITGYFPMLEDNYAVQLDNEAKIRFGMSYIHSSAGKNYSQYHVIAATNLFMDGSEGKEDYLYIGNNFTMKDVLNTQQYLHCNNYAYWITGAQVREWLEWSAGIFAESGEKITSEEVLKKLTESQGADSLLADGWLEHYDRYVIMDGLEYEIDASVPPRYSYYGDLLNENARRITRLTYNGEEVADDTRFILVDNYKSKGTPVIGSFLYNQRLSSRQYRCTYYFKEYVRELGSFGRLTNQVDNNWSVNFGDSLKRIVRSSSLSVKAAELKPWYVDTLEETEDRAYYLADFRKEETGDTTGPLLVLCPSATVETNRDVKVYAQASDSSGISRLLCLNGSYDKDAGEWQDAAEIVDGAFTVTENGVYSVCAEDGQGNRTVKNIQVSNINRDILQNPVVDKFTNKKTNLTGETQPGFTVLVQVGKKNYSVTAAEDGSFKCHVGKHSAGEEISVYVVDSSSGKVSRMVKSTVLRRGPNVPALSSVSNKTVTLTGSVNDTNSTILVENGTKVFVPASRGKAIYKGCTRYNKKLGISEADEYTVDENGKFSIKIPVQKVSVELIVYGVDTQGRVSLLRKTKVADAAPNKPTVYTVSDGQKYVMGKVPSPKKEGRVIVRAGDEKYTGTFGESGNFVVRTKGFEPGVTISVTATDVKAGQTRTSLETTSKVVSQAQYKIAAGKSKISVGTVSNRSTTIQGKVTAEGAAYINYGDNCAKLTVDKSGSFSYHLPQALSSGEDITVTRHNKTTGELEEVKEVSFHLVKPYEPQLKKKKITTKKTTVTVYGREEATLIVKTKDGSRVVEECSYSKSKKRYVYKVKLPKGEGKVRMYLQNDAGNSKILEVTRKK